MLTSEVLALWLVLAVLAFGLWTVVLKRFFSAEARERRRRRRSYGRTKSRRGGPSVKLASKVPRS